VEGETCMSRISGSRAASRRPWGRASPCASRSPGFRSRGSPTVWLLLS